MIWGSTWAMTVVDLLIVGGVGFVLWYYYSHRDSFRRAGYVYAPALTAFGLCVIALFYAADLVLMHALPVLAPESDPAAAMETLHLNYSWIAITVGVGAVCAGFVFVNRGLFITVDELTASQRELSAETRAHKGTQSALQASRDRLARILEIATDAVISIDGEGRIISFNQGAERMFGYGAGDVVGEPLDVLLPERYRERHHRYLMGFIAGEDVSRVMGTRVEIAGLRLDGTEFPAEAGISKIKWQNDIICMVMMRDISERKRHEVELQQAQKMEAVGQLTGGVAHDFNNLLLVIMGNLELLAEDYGEDARAYKLIRPATDAARRGAALTQRLLAFSRKQVLRAEPVDLNQLIAGMDELLRRTIGEDIDIETITAGGLWTCEADPTQLESVLLNLCVNARDAMPEGGKLTVETSNARLDDDYVAAHVGLRPGQYVVLAVTDTGPGMAPDVVERAFEPFFTTKEVGRGTGLGLSMVYGFVKQSNGHVKIYSEPGHGTTLKVYLPRRMAPAQIEAGGRRREPGSYSMGNGETVLLVEDDKSVRAVLVRILEDLNYVVVQAGEGAAALRVLEGSPEAVLLLTDVVLPGGMNGAELGKEALSRRPGLKVLYTSGYTDNAIVHHGRLAPGAELIEKPFAKAALARKIDGILN